MRDHASCVYILTSRAGSGRPRVLYIGVTADLSRRIAEHKSKSVPSFAAKYGVNTLVYFEMYGDIRAAIAREKEIKGWVRSKKIRLVTRANPKWVELIV